MIKLMKRAYLTDKRKTAHFWNSMVYIYMKYSHPYPVNMHFDFSMTTHMRFGYDGKHR